MALDRIKESGALENLDNPATDDWIGNIDSDFIDAKIAEYEKQQAEAKAGNRDEMDEAKMEALFDRYSAKEIKSLDENTIDTDFLPRARNADGTEASGNAWHKYSPHASQEDSGGKMMPEGFKVGHLENGTVLYQLGKEDASGEWFTDSETVKSCMDPNTGEVDISKLKEKLQIEDENNEKNTLRCFKVDSPDGIKVAEGITSENKQYGDGGGTQYFVTPDHRKLTELTE